MSDRATPVQPLESDPRMSAEDEAIYAGIIHEQVKPDPALLEAGWNAHASGKGFHESPHPMFTVAGLCWRIGWNDRALKHGPPGTSADEVS